MLLKVGIQVLQAGFRKQVAGDFSSEIITVKGVYSVDFPLPKRLKFDGYNQESFIIDLEKNNIDYDNVNFSSNDSIIDDEGKSHSGDWFQPTSFEYAELPVTVLVKIKDPVLIESHRPFRFTLMINENERFITDALIRIVLHTNKGICKSGNIYLKS